MIKHPRLHNYRHVVAGHQPMLFGNDGYFSKILAADEYLCTFSVPYKQHDGVNQLILPDGSSVRLPIAKRDRPLNDAVVYGCPNTVLKSFEQHFMSKRRPFRHRVIRVAEALVTRKDEPYPDLWGRVFMETLRAAGFSMKNWGLTIDRGVAEGRDTQDRLEARLNRADQYPDAYLLGPAAYHYMHRPPVIPMFVHRMEKPSVRSFLQTIVTEEEPLARLREYGLKRLDVPTVRAEHSSSLSA